MLLKDIVQEYLEKHGFTAVVNPELNCGCTKDNLFPCKHPSDGCQAGYYNFCDDCQHPCVENPEASDLETCFSLPDTRQEG